MQEATRECEYKRNASEEWPRTERLLDCSKPVLNYRNFWTPLEARTEGEEASCTYYLEAGYHSRVSQLCMPGLVGPGFRKMHGIGI